MRTADRYVKLVDCPVCGAKWMESCITANGTRRHAHGPRRLLAFTEGLVTNEYDPDKGTMVWSTVEFDDIPQTS